MVPFRSRRSIIGLGAVLALVLIGGLWASQTLRGPLVTVPSPTPKPNTPPIVAISQPTPVPTLTPVPANLALRMAAFGWPYFKFISLNEQSVGDLYHLDLSKYYFPRNYPLSVQGDSIYLSLHLPGEGVLVKTLISQRTLSRDCTPSPKLDELLCALHNLNYLDRTALTAQFGDEYKRLAIEKAASDYLDGNLRKDYFILRLDNAQIILVPAYDPSLGGPASFRTKCRWQFDDRIVCITPDSTKNGIWTTWIFDPLTNGYDDLPDNGHNIYVYGRYSYVQTFFSSEQSLPGPVRVFGADGRLLYATQASFLATPAGDQVLMLESCKDTRLCLRLMQLGPAGVEQNLDTELGDARGQDGERCFPSMGQSSDAFVLTVCDQVYSIDKSDLRIDQILLLPPRAQNYDQSVLYRDKAHVLVSKGPCGVFPDRLYNCAGAALFDLGRCRGALDASCLTEDWPVETTTDPISVYANRSRILYYPGAPDSNLVTAVTTKDRTITISRVDSGATLSVAFPEVPDPAGATLDERYLLVSTSGSLLGPPNEKEYHLVELSTGNLIPLEMTPGQNLIFVPQEI